MQVVLVGENSQKSHNVGMFARVETLVCTCLTIGKSFCKLCSSLVFQQSLDGKVILFRFTLLSLVMAGTVGDMAGSYSGCDEIMVRRMYHYPADN